MNSDREKTLPCWIYRGSRKDEMYLYLAKKDAFESLPQDLLQRFGRPTLVLELELHSALHLARVDVGQVFSSLKERGFHLQLPTQMVPDLYHLN